MMFDIDKSDLKGYIKGFPVVIVDVMMQHQVAQGNKPNIEVFQRVKGPGKFRGGFNWDETKVYADKTGSNRFWSSVINYRNFGTFFNRFPELKECDLPRVSQESAQQEPDEKKLPDIDFMTDELYTPKDQQVILDEEDDNPFEGNEEKLPEIGEGIKVTNTDTFGTCKRVYVGYIKDTEFPIMTVTAACWEKMKNTNESSRCFDVSLFKYYQKIDKNPVVEVTMEDVIKKFGMNVKIVDKKQWGQI